MRRNLRDQTRDKIRSLFWISVALLTTASCGNLAASPAMGSVDEWLRSENSLMKKRITSLERENAVLAKENTDQLKMLRNLQAKILALQSEVGDWKVKYLGETETLSGELRDLQEAKASLEEESAEKMQELEAVHESDRRRYEAEIEMLNQQLSRQTEAFDRERESIRSETVKEKGDLARRIEDLGKDIASRDALIESLRNLNEDLSRKYENSLKEIGEKTRSLQILQEEIQRLRGGSATPRDARADIPPRIQFNAP